MTAERTPQGPAPCLSPGTVPAESDGRRYSPSFERNAEPIRAALADILGAATGTLIEIGAGTGQHAAALAPAFPGLRWVPTDRDPGNAASIAAWRAHAPCPTLAEGHTLDASGDWPAALAAAGVTSATAIFSANVIHIAPWSVATGIITGAARILAPDGALIFYGPFREDGVHTGDGNATFDTCLRATDPAWGIRDVGELADCAAQAGFGPPALRTMPSNNRMLTFRLTRPSP